MMHLIITFVSLISSGVAQCTHNQCLSSDAIGVCTNGTLIEMSCGKDIQQGSSCAAIDQEYQFHCYQAENEVQSLVSQAECKMDTCGTDPLKPYILNRCFAGRIYPTNCNQVLHTIVGGALCYPELGAHGSAICDYVSNHTGSTTSMSRACASTRGLSTTAADDDEPGKSPQANAFAQGTRVIMDLF